MDDDFVTSFEQRWVNRLSRCFKDQPKDLLLYSLDGEIIVCKKGVSSNDFQEIVRAHICAGNMLTDIHDDMDNGLHIR
jgi:hypothetical protein